MFTEPITSQAKRTTSDIVNLSLVPIGPLGEQFNSIYYAFTLVAI